MQISLAVKWHILRKTGIYAITTYAIFASTLFQVVPEINERFQSMGLCFFNLFQGENKHFLLLPSVLQMLSENLNFNHSANHNLEIHCICIFAGELKHKNQAKCL